MFDSTFIQVCAESSLVVHKSSQASAFESFSFNLFLFYVVKVEQILVESMAQAGQRETLEFFITKTFHVEPKAILVKNSSAERKCTKATLFDP